MHLLQKVNYWDVKRKVEMLKKLSSSKEQPDKHFHLIKSAFTGVRSAAITIENDVIYRSRWNKQGGLFSNTSELGYPNNSDVKQKGRLNNKGESILYAAACELGTIIESRPDIGKLFTISTIKLSNSNLLFFPLGITDKGYYGKKTSSAEKLIIEYVNSEIIKVVDDPEDYNSTIALSKFYLRTNIIGSNSSGCIAYPSVESSKISNKTTYNFAIIPKVFDKYFTFTDAKVYCLIHLKEHYQLTAMNQVTEINNTGNLIWKYSYTEMTKRIKDGLSLDGRYYKEIKCIQIK